MDIDIDIDLVFSQYLVQHSINLALPEGRKSIEQDNSNFTLVRSRTIALRSGKWFTKPTKFAFKLYVKKGMGTE